MKDHSPEVTGPLVYTITAYAVRPETLYGWKQLPSLELLQQIVAQVYHVSSPNGYILQKEHTTIGELGAYWLNAQSDIQSALLAQIKKVWHEPPNWRCHGLCKEVCFNFALGYDGDGQATYMLYSEQMRKNFASALSASGIANRYFGHDRDRQMHSAEKAEQDDLQDIEPTGWQPMLKL